MNIYSLGIQIVSYPCDSAKKKKNFRKIEAVLVSHVSMHSSPSIVEIPILGKVEERLHDRSWYI